MTLHIELVLKTVIKYFDLTPRQMFKFSRDRSIVYPRQVFFYLSNKWCSKSLADIGLISKKYGRKNPHDHSSVLHGKKKIIEYLFYDPRVVQDVMIIEKSLRKYQKEKYKIGETEDSLSDQINYLRELHYELEDYKETNIDLLRIITVLKNEGLPEDEKHLLEMYRNVDTQGKNDIMFKVKVAYKMQEK